METSRCDAKHFEISKADNPLLPQTGLGHQYTLGRPNQFQKICVQDSPPPVTIMMEMQSARQVSVASRGCGDENQNEYCGILNLSPSLVEES